MNLLGYGITLNSQPKGIWPMSLETAQASASRYRHSAPSARVEVVPVYAGTPIAARVPSFQPIGGKSA